MRLAIATAVFAALASAVCGHSHHRHRHRPSLLTARSRRLHSSLLRHRRAEAERALDDATRTMEAVVEKAGQAVKAASMAIRASEAEEETVMNLANDPAGDSDRSSRERMDNVEAFRAEMCMERPDLVQHEKCIQYLSSICPQEFSSKGHCEKFFKLLAGKCREEEEQVRDDEREYCSLYHRLQPMHPNLFVTHGQRGDGAEGDQKPEQEREQDTVESEDKDPASDEAAEAPAPAPGGAPGPALPPTNIDKVERDLPTQGYNEYDEADGLVQHNDKETQMEDWLDERGEGTKADMMHKVCADENSLYCKLWLRDWYNRHGHGPKVRRTAPPEHIGWFNRFLHDTFGPFN